MAMASYAIGDGSCGYFFGGDGYVYFDKASGKHFANNSLDIPEVRFDGEKWMRVPVQKAESVSYTHLTLPTKA